MSATGPADEPTTADPTTPSVTQSQPVTTERSADTAVPDTPETDAQPTLSQSETTTGGSGPGFGVLAAVVALLGPAFVGRRWR